MILRRTDISSLRYYEVRRYTLKYQGAEDLKQAVVTLRKIGDWRSLIFEGVSPFSAFFCSGRP